jgi:cytochrome c553
VRYALTAVLALAALSGCGGGGGPKLSDEVVQGRQLFQTGGRDGAQLSCGFCHTMKAAETIGRFGPSLDQESAEYQRQKLTLEQKREFVLRWIKEGSCLDPHEPSRCMPAALFKGNEAEAIAAFVARCGNQPGLKRCKPVKGGLTGQAGKGQRAFADLGCVGCHWADRTEPIGPTFVGLYGSDVKLVDGRTVKADDRYLLDSILKPDKDIVLGYARGAMSGRVQPGFITEDQAKALVAYIKSLE